MLAEPVDVSFGTGAGADLVSPVVVHTNPVNGAEGVVRDVVVTVEFSEPLNPLTVNTMTLTLRNLTTGQVVEAAVALDTTRTLATFSATVRDEVDLDQLGTTLMAVVEETMQPAHVSLWLCPPKGSSEKTTRALPIIETVGKP